MLLLALESVSLATVCAFFPCPVWPNTNGPRWWHSEEGGGKRVPRQRIVYTIEGGFANLAGSYLAHVVGTWASNVRGRPRSICTGNTWCLLKNSNCTRTLSVGVWWRYVRTSRIASGKKKETLADEFYMTTRARPRTRRPPTRGSRPAYENSIYL